jgi:outer membrane protein TolC
LKEALRIGIDSSKSLKISSSKVQLAEAKYKQALDATIPSVRFSANYTRLSDIEEPKFLFPGTSEPITLFPVYVNNYSTSITLSETIFSGFRLKYARDSQQLLRDAASFENEHNRNMTAFSIIQAFFNLYKLKVSAIVVQKNLELIKEKVRETQLAQKNGIVTKNDVLRWQLQQTNVELALLDLKNNIDISNFNFNLMLGFNGEKKIIPDTNLLKNIFLYLLVPEKTWSPPACIQKLHTMS